MTGGLCAALVGCGDDAGDDGMPMPMEDGGVGDGGPPDAGPDDGGPPDDGPFTEAEVQQLFDARGCSQAGCHAASTQRAGMSLEGFVEDTVGVRSTQTTLDRIEPGDHQASYLWHKVNDTHRDVGGSGSRMPLARPMLPQLAIDRLAGYIDALDPE